MKDVTVSGHLHDTLEHVYTHRQLDNLFAVGVWRVLLEDQMIRLDGHVIVHQEKFEFAAAFFNHIQSKMEIKIAGNKNKQQN